MQSPSSKISRTTNPSFGKKALAVTSTIAALSALLSFNVFAQAETAIPFLLISPAPDGNGWGNISTAVPSANPIAHAVNPGQLGFFSLNTHAAASSYIHKTDWLPSFQGDLTYNAWGLSAGYNFKELLSLPFSLSAGIGYSRIDLDLGTFVATGPGGPEPIATVEAFEKAGNFSAGFGIEYFVRLGIGWNFKEVQSKLGAVSTSPLRQAEAAVSTSDFGFILQAPFGKLFTCGSDSASGGIRPLLDLTLGYSIANRGDETVMYSGIGQQDPLPRFAIAGASMEIGITKRLLDLDWKILTFTIAREADDLLVSRNPDGTFEYQDGLGDISFFTNVIGGKADDNGVNSRKGWQINFAEFILIRRGSYSELPEWGGRNYSTSGYAFRLGGGLKLLEAILPGSTTGSVVSFLRTHIDLSFDHADYSDHDILGGTSFDALTLIFR